MYIVLDIISGGIEIDSHQSRELVDVRLGGGLATTPGAVAKENEGLEPRGGHFVEGIYE